MQPDTQDGGDRLPLYEKLASDLARQIQHGTFQAGQRLPSVRQTSRQRRLSITTVLQAYRLLEDQGLVEARPQSGYYVRAATQPVVVDPGLAATVEEPSLVSIDSMVMQVLRDTLNQKLVQFGAALPAPDLLPTEKLNRILASLLRRKDVLQHIYGVPEGFDGLRVQVARRALEAGCEITPSEVVVTSGCTEAINLALRAVCRPGDMVAIESPAFFGILQNLESQGLQALEIPTHPRDGISISALKLAFETHPIRACVVNPNFHNPLGSTMPDVSKKELVELISDYHIPLIEDDIQGELYFSGERPRVAKTYDKRGLVMLCSSYSKDISPSYRVGWIAPGRFLPEIVRLKMSASLGTAILPQMTIASFLESGGYDHHLRRIRRVYAQRVVQMAEAVCRYFPAGTRVTSPGGGFVLWVQMPEKANSITLYRQALKAGITITPGTIFSPSPRYRNYIRLSAAIWSNETQGALRLLGDLVERNIRGEA